MLMTCLLAVTGLACKRDRAREIEPVTTTGAEVPVAEPAWTETVPPPAPQETVNTEGDPATARPTQAEAVDITGANRDVEPKRSSAPAESRDNASGSGAYAPASEVRGGALEQPAINPRDRTGSSFESSGGTSGLGTYGRDKVPGQERFEVKGNKADGGK